MKKHKTQRNRIIEAFRDTLESYLNPPSINKALRTEEDNFKLYGELCGLKHALILCDMRRSDIDDIKNEIEDKINKHLK